MAGFDAGSLFERVRSMSAQKDGLTGAGSAQGYAPTVQNGANVYKDYLAAAAPKPVSQLGSGAAAGAAFTGGTGDVNKLLGALKMVESGGKYDSRSPYASASGAYGMIDSTWGGYGGYAHAWQAPPQVQDAKALQLLQGKLNTYGGDWRKTAQSWFYPAQAGNDSYAPGGAGNGTVTLGDYWKRIQKYL